jgi:hypothetical protein
MESKFYSYHLGPANVPFICFPAGDQLPSKPTIVKNEANAPRSGCIHKKFDVERRRQSDDINATERLGEASLPPLDVFNDGFRNEMGDPWRRDVGKGGVEAA